MTKNIAAAILAAFMAACGAPVEHAESCTNASAPASAAPIENDKTPPAAPVIGQDAGRATREKPENEKTTFEYCAGYWNCFDFGGTGFAPMGMRAWSDRR